MSRKLTGTTPLAYMGVEASTPPQLVVHDRAPTANDYASFVVGTIWIYNTDPEEVWMLVAKDHYVSTWVKFLSGSIPGAIATVTGGDNINTIDPSGPDVIVNLNKSIFQPVTSSDGTEGLYALGGVDFLHNYGTQNTFIGGNTGNRTLTVLSATENTGCGYQVLAHVTTGELNTGLGDTALGNITTGLSNLAAGHDSLSLATTSNYCTSLGGNSLGQLLTGNRNISLGYDSGYAYEGAESNNITIGNAGVLGESNTIRIGTQGAGAGQQDKAYMAGIWGTTLATSRGVMEVDENGQLGMSRGWDGQVLIGALGASPEWATITSSDGSITFSTGPNTLDMIAIGGGGGGGATTFITDIDSPAVIDGSNITFTGGGPLFTDGGGGSHTVTIDMINGGNGQVLLGGGAVPVWADITSSGTVAITRGPGTLNLEAVGTGGAIIFHSDSGDAIAVGGEVTVAGGLNINTSGATSVVTVNLDTSIVQPVTNATGTEGLYTLGTHHFLHNYGTYNTFLGEDAGNLTLTASSDNTAIGSYCMNVLTTGMANTGIGSDSSRDISTGSYNAGLGYQSNANVSTGGYNTACGAQSLNAITTGSNNTALGVFSGSNLTVNDSSNIIIGNVGTAGLNNTIKIGTQGSGAGQQSTTYMAGIWGSTPAATSNVVFVDNTGKLGVFATGAGKILIGSSSGVPVWANITPGAGIAIVNGDGTITISATGGGGSITQIAAGANINVTNPTGPITTVAVKDAIYLPTTNGDNIGVYGINGKPVLHTRGTNSVFVGADSSPTGFTPVNNTAVGALTLTNNVIGQENAVLGYGAGYSSNASVNTYIGSRSATYNLGYGNVAVGAYSLYSPGTITASNCIAIGYQAAYPAVSASYGISIGNATISSNSTRLGTTGTHTSTYVAGIWGKSLGSSPAKAVYVTADGLLGTGSNTFPAFLGIQSGTASNVTGDGSTYWLGTTTACNQIYDLGGNYNPGGGGTPSIFTAPVSGLYFLEVQFLVGGLVQPPAPVAPNTDPTIYTSNRSYSLINSIFEAQTNEQQSYFYNAVCDMDAADEARFNIQILFGTGAKTLDILPTQTFVSGYLIREY